MLTRGEQAAADAYERRRLVEALVGSPDTPHRSHVGAAGAGLVLAVLVAVGLAARAWLAPGPATVWSACTADGAGIAFAVPSAPHLVAAAGRGAVVTSGDTDSWLVAADAGGHAARYRVPAGAPGDELLTTAGLPPAAQAVRVPSEWLALFDAAGTFASDTWVRAHWASASLQPLAALVCAELVTDQPSPYVRLATLPPDAVWSAPAPGVVSRDLVSAIVLPRRLPAAWLALQPE